MNIKELRRVMKHLERIDQDMVTLSANAEQYSSLGYSAMMGGLIQVQNSMYERLKDAGITLVDEEA